MTTTTKRAARAVVTEYSALIRKAEQADDTELADKLLVERNAKIAALRSR